MKKDKKALYESIMKTVAKEVKKSLNERSLYHPSLYNILTEHMTNGIIEAWDDYGLIFSHQDIKDALAQLATEYDVDKHLSWTSEHMD